MSRPVSTGVLTCPDVAPGQSRPAINTTPGETWVLSGMIEKGRSGITTRDFLGADLRHYIRSLRNKGVSIRDEWETDEFGQHKRWYLKDGYNLERKLKTKKPATAATVQVLDPNPNGKNGGLSDVQ